MSDVSLSFSVEMSLFLNSVMFACQMMLLSAYVLTAYLSKSIIHKEITRKRKANVKHLILYPVSVLIGYCQTSRSNCQSKRVAMNMPGLLWCSWMFSAMLSMNYTSQTTLHHGGMLCIFNCPTATMMLMMMSSFLVRERRRSSHSDLFVCFAIFFFLSSFLSLFVQQTKWSIHLSRFLL